MVLIFALLVVGVAAAKEESQPLQFAPVPSSEGKSLLEVLANGGSLPPGDEYEIIRRAPDGSLHVLDVDGEGSNGNPALPPPGATVVLLEEKPGGGYEVRGVQSSAPVEQIQGLLENIQEGGIQLPSGEKSSNRVFFPPMPTGIPPGPTTALPYKPVAPEERPTARPTMVAFPENEGRTQEYRSRPAAREEEVTTTLTPRTRPRVSQTVAPTTERQRVRAHQRRRPSEDYSDEAEEEAEETEIVPETRESLRTSLTEVLRREGYKEMARFMERAGLQDMLTSTGPYTIFAPTDEAFKQLMTQLGGTKRAEAKFKENPRLLSGLMLHHVIPGTFKVNTLQDEMTGVSLAGTQLRVNVYEPKMVAVNGARIQRADIWVPGGGVAHAIDSVLFPLPVGDILHTLLSDTRFSRFLKIVHSADLEDVLSGKRTYTLFAPTDQAFESLSVGELSKLEGDRSKARALVARHLVPGAIYTSGLKAYQVRYTMQQGVTIKLHSESGTLKINSSRVTTQNIPATNGVVHAIDTLL